MPSFSLADVTSLFTIMDLDGNGVVDKYEFLEYARLNKPASGVYGTVARLTAGASWRLAWGPRSTEACGRPRSWCSGSLRRCCACWGKLRLVLNKLDRHLHCHKPNHMNPEEAVKTHLDLKSQQSVGVRDTPHPPFFSGKLEDDGVSSRLRIDVDQHKGDVVDSAFLEHVQPRIAVNHNPDRCWVDHRDGTACC